MQFHLIFCYDVTSYLILPRKSDRIVCVYIYQCDCIVICNVSFNFVTGDESFSKGPETINGLVPLNYTILVHRLAPQLSPVDKFEAAIGRSFNIKFNSNMIIY